MGVDVSLTTKRKDVSHHLMFTRTFRDFILSSDAYQNSEFEQIQHILKVDLSSFRYYPVYENEIENQEGKLHYEISLAERDKDYELVAVLQKKIKALQIAFKANADKDYRGWIKVEELETITQQFIDAILENSDYHLKIKYNSNWGNYFYNSKKEASDAIKYFTYYERTHPILIDELNKMLEWLKAAKLLEAKWVSFIIL